MISGKEKEQIKRNTDALNEEYAVARQCGIGREMVWLAAVHHFARDLLRRLEGGNNDFKRQD